MEKYCPKCFKKYPASLKECPADGTNLVAFHEGELTGRVLDKRYTVLERIGRGGMGVVYKAEQQLIKRIVALKVLRREVVQDENAVKRFLTEARATSLLQSPHTVTLHDFGVTDEGLLYYTMELLRGRSVSRLIKTEAPLEYRRAVDLVLQACDSLEEAHEQNILHRDIKPDNLFVVTVRGKESVKVLDFGIAKLIGDASMESLTKTGSIIGTPQYLSPEQAKGNPVLPASDLYSLGIVLYEMLTGVPPFLADTPMKTLWKHVQEEPEPIHVKNPDIEVPRSVDLFLRKALEKEPGRRFQSAAAFREGLERALAQHDASPETVTLASLSSTEGGLRVRTDPMYAEQPETEEEGGGAPSPELARTDTAEPVLLDPEPAHQDFSASEADLSGNPEIAPAPGPDTLALLSAIRGRMTWIVGVVAATVLLGGLFIWRPWNDIGKGKTDAEAARKTETTTDAEPGNDSAVENKDEARAAIEAGNAPSGDRLTKADSMKSKSAGAEKASQTLAKQETDEAEEGRIPDETGKGREVRLPGKTAEGQGVSEKTAANGAAEKNGAKEEGELAGEGEESHKVEQGKEPLQDKKAEGAEQVDDAELASKAEEERKAEMASKAAEEKKAVDESAGKAEKKRKAEQARKDEEKKKAAAEVARRAEEKREAEQARKDEERRKAEAAKKAEEEREADEAHRRLEAERKKREEEERKKQEDDDFEGMEIK